MNAASTEDMIYAADLYCGAGGLTSGLMRAAEELGKKVDLVAVNHWPVAVNTHSQNFPNTRHLCEAIDNVSPKSAVPGGYLDFLLAAPECTFHSNARGSKPINDQLRTNAWRIVEWLSQLDVQYLLIENVPEFMKWGPVDAEGKRIKADEGKTFRAFVAAIRAEGYTVEHRILKACQYGDPTSRARFFLIAAKGKRKKIKWPEITHVSATEFKRTKDNPTFAHLKPYRTAREIIDWEIRGKSIYGRKKPLSQNTLRRIFAGFRKHSGLPFLFNLDEPGDEPLIAPDPYLVVLRNHCAGQSIDEPAPTLCASGQHVGLCQPYLIALQHYSKGEKGHERRSYPLTEPIQTLTGKNGFALCNPQLLRVAPDGFVVNMKGQSNAASLDAPLLTQTSQSHLYLANPYLVKYYLGSDAVSVDEPVPAITANYEHLALTQPYLVPFYSENGKQKPRSHSIDDPLPTATAQGRIGVANPILLRYNGSHEGHTDGDARSQPVDLPIGTLDTSNRYAVCNPVIVQYNGATQTALPIDDPLPTIPTRDRFALVEPVLRPDDQIYYLDFEFRMLEPKELARAHDFPANYIFTGTREDQVRQVGNSVPVAMSTALATSLFTMREARRKG